MAKHQIKSMSRDLAVGFVMGMNHQGDVEIDSIENADGMTVVSFHDVGKNVVEGGEPDSISILLEGKGLVLTHLDGVPLRSAKTLDMKIDVPTDQEVLDHFKG